MRTASERGGNQRLILRRKTMTDRKHVIVMTKDGVSNLNGTTLERANVNCIIAL